MHANLIQIESDAFHLKLFGGSFGQNAFYKAL
ncbi:MAG: hypothetical protein K0Q55_3457 [Verrucomicrobia bacterium]|nr:hypothetical protein [Verrucomicrobiota bacterium]